MNAEEVSKLEPVQRAAREMGLIVKDQAELDVRLADLLDNMRYTMRMGDTPGTFAGIALDAPILLVAAGASDEYIQTHLLDVVNSWGDKNPMAQGSDGVSAVRTSAIILSGLMGKVYTPDVIRRKLRMSVVEQFDLVEQVLHAGEFATMFSESAAKEGAVDDERFSHSLEVAIRTAKTALSYAESDPIGNLRKKVDATRALFDGADNLSPYAHLFACVSVVIILVLYGLAPNELLEQISMDVFDQDLVDRIERKDEDELAAKDKMDTLRRLYYSMRGWKK